MFLASCSAPPSTAGRHSLHYGSENLYRYRPRSSSRACRREFLARLSRETQVLDANAEVVFLCLPFTMNRWCRSRYARRYVVMMACLGAPHPIVWKVTRKRRRSPCNVCSTQSSTYDLFLQFLRRFCWPSLYIYVYISRCNTSDKSPHFYTMRVPQMPPFFGGFTLVIGRPICSWKTPESRAVVYI